MRSFFLMSALGIAVLAGSVTTASADWAIAVGQSNNGHYAYGTGYNAANARAARQTAMSGCRENGPGCKVVAEGNGTCAAIAFGTDDNAYGWSEGDTEREARRLAERKCLGFTNGGECEVRSAFCDQ